MGKTICFHAASAAVGELSSGSLRRRRGSIWTGRSIRAGPPKLPVHQLDAANAANNEVAQENWSTYNTKSNAGANAELASGASSKGCRPCELPQQQRSAWRSLLRRRLHLRDGASDPVDVSPRRRDLPEVREGLVHRVRHALAPSSVSR